MEKIPAALLRAIDAFSHYREEKARFSKTLHSVHNLSGELEQALKDGMIDEIAELKKLFAAEERTLHGHAHEFDKTLLDYQRALRQTDALVNRSLKVVVAGKAYQFVKKAKRVNLHVIKQA